MYRSVAKTLLGIFSLLVLVPVCGAQAGTRQSPATPIHAGAEIDYPPFSDVTEDGVATGFSVELLRAAANAMGREISYETGTWTEIKQQLIRGQLDALPVVGRTLEREAVLDFTFPYLSLYGAIVLRKDETGIRTLNDLTGRQVAVMADDNAEELLRRQPGPIDIRLTTTFEDALRQLSQGRHDAVIAQRLVALRLLREIGLSNLRVVQAPLRELRQDFCFAVTEDDTDTLALLNEGLSLVIADGTFRRLQAKWFGTLQLPTNERIVVGGDHNYPPYEFLDEHGQPTGYNVELTRAIAGTVGLEVEIHLDDWNTIREGLKGDTIDAVQGMFYSADRDLEFDFSQPHTMVDHVAVTRTGTPTPSAIEELTGLRLVVMDGDIMHDLVRQHRLMGQTTTVATQEEALRTVAEGRADCALVARLPAHYWIIQHGWELDVSRQPFLSMEYCYAVPERHGSLLARFSEGLTLVKESGEYREISERWMGVSDHTSPTLLVRLRHAAVVLVPLAALLVAALVWTWLLRREVRRQTAALRTSEAQFRSLVDSAPLAIFVQTNDTFAYVNQAGRRILGIESPTELVGRPVMDCLHPSQRETVRDRLALLNDLQEHFGPTEEFLVRPDGEEITTEISAVPITFENHPGALVFVRDITEQKSARQRIDHLNTVLHAIRDINHLIVREHDSTQLINAGCKVLVEHRGYLSAAMILIDEDGQPAQWAEAGIEELDRSPLRDQLEGGELPPCCAMKPDEDGLKVITRRSEICAAHLPVAHHDHGSLAICAHLVHAEEPVGYLIVSIQPELFAATGERELLAELANDLAYALSGIRRAEAHQHSEHERKALARQLSQAQKMEAVGRLAGGVAHDFNNNLTVILGYTEMALLRMSPSDPLHKRLTEIQKAATSSANLTRQLLAFARQQTVVPKVLDPDETIETMLMMLRRLIGEEIDLVWTPGQGTWPVRMDPAQIDQILANLAVNARDAIEGVGAVTLQTQNVHIDPASCADIEELEPGEYVLLTVSDTGCGMDQTTLQSVFEPFFTTKPMGQGTGLGLSTVYGIVKQNDGFITVDSAPGEGTTFRIYIPRAAADEDSAPAESGTPTVRGHETILLVEDELPLLDLTRELLESLGYTVHAAASPTQALWLARQHSAGLQLLLTDVVMPEMNGSDLWEQLKGICSDLPCLFMSGYTADVIAERGIVDEGVHFIQKPFSEKALAAAVRVAIES